VAGGVARRLRIDPTLVRIAFVVVAVVGGFGFAAYVAAWLLMPMEGQSRSIGARAVRDRHGIMLSIAFLPALVAVLVVGGALHLGFVTSAAWPFFIGAAVLVLLWRNTDAEERTWLRSAAEPVVHFGTRSRRSRRWLVLRVAAGVLVLAVGVAVLLGVRRPDSTTLVRPAGGVILVVIAIVVVFGPWWLRLFRDLIAERQARARAEERADMAARVHDSVLQTLAMIQRSAGQPQKVVQLARAQERELRAWLFDGDLPGTAGDGAASLAAGVQSIANEVEAVHEVPVEVVTVGDCPLDDRMQALLGAAREATVNAAKWSQAHTISLFAEVEPARASVFVRDRGRGFDPDAVADDRRGIAESIQARMIRQGGQAVVRTAVGEGTEVELCMPRRRDR